MGDMKSKLPDLEELTHMAGKLFNDIKKSVTEIAAAYKEKRQTENTSAEEVTEAKPTPAAKKEAPEPPKAAGKSAAPTAAETPKEKTDDKPSKAE